jgi:hypothetical protein
VSRAGRSYVLPQVLTVPTALLAPVVVTSTTSAAPGDNFRGYVRDTRYERELYLSNLRRDDDGIITGAP